MPKPRNKEVALPVTIAGVAMAAMLGTWQPRILRIPHENMNDLKFQFPANQTFDVTFMGDRLVAAEMHLVVGREPTRSAMQVVQNQTNVDTVELFSRLVCDDCLDVNVTSDEGFSLDRDDLTLAELGQVDSDLAQILTVLIGLDIEPSSNAGDRKEVQDLLAELKKRLVYQLAA